MLREDLLTLDLKEMSARIEAYKERARQADRVVITIVCCDSRVVLPEELVTVQKEDDTTEQVLFITLPTIGSGAPSRSRLRGIQAELEKNWVLLQKKFPFYSPSMVIPTKLRYSTMNQIMPSLVDSVKCYYKTVKHWVRSVVGWQHGRMSTK